ncbi:MAG: Crp/Fnr family transcriptional regulator [Phycisphaerae bacterium]|nr:Crp/Fnr family transcriptional regulator [Phycisphaerae bacterium]
MVDSGNSPIQRYLQQCGLFRGLNEASTAKLAEISISRRFSKGQTIFREGAPCPGIYVMAEGLVRVVKYAPSGKEHVLHLAYPGMTFAEVAAIGRFPCPATAEAMEDTLCVLILQDRLTQLLRADHALCLQIMETFAWWVKHFVGLLEDLVLRDSTGRVARHLLHAGAAAGEEAFLLPMLKKDLASHLNLTGETLSRTIRRLADAGLIELLDQQRIRIMDRARLEDVAAGLPAGEFD